MHIDKTHTKIIGERLAGGGWGGREVPITKRDPWVGLTPEQAYQRGFKDGQHNQQDQQRALDELNHPERRPRCSPWDIYSP